VKARKKINVNSLTVEEAKAFVLAKGNLRYGRAFVFQLHTGLRNQELMALIWDDVDFEKGTLRVERACKWVGGHFEEIGPPKTERSNRVIELEPEHLDLLREQLRVQQEAVETSRKQQSPYGEDRVEDWVKKERPRHAHLYKNTNLIFPKHDGTGPERGHTTEGVQPHGATRRNRGREKDSLVRPTAHARYFPPQRRYAPSPSR
jgi:integrase